MSGSNIDMSKRTCQCGHYLDGVLDRECAENCLGTFSLLDYAPGYFPYKYQVRKGSAVNTCPTCEVAIVKAVIEKGTLSRSTEGSMSSDISLIETWRIESGLQRKKCLRTHGAEVLRAMEDTAAMGDRGEAVRLVKKAVLAAR